MPPILWKGRKLLPLSAALRTSASSYEMRSSESALQESANLQAAAVEPSSTFSPNNETPPGKNAAIGLLDLPEELQQRILDMLVGELQSPLGSASGADCGMRNWNSVMRHPRGRNMANLSLVCTRWRRLVQARIYRHLKIQGTIDEITETHMWFFENTHLRSYVKHVEFWVPIWQRRGGPRDMGDPRSTTMIDMAVDVSRHATNNSGRLRNGDGIQAVEPINSAYCLSTQRSTLDELCYCILNCFPAASIMTIEGGHCKESPMIQYTREDLPPEDANWSLPVLRQIQTLVFRGAWNIMRYPGHWLRIVDSFPEVKEFQCAYTTSMAASYMVMDKFLQRMPQPLTRLNISLDGSYDRPHISPRMSQFLMRDHHMCRTLGKLIHRMEAVTLSGRICRCIFAYCDKAPLEETRLKSIDLVVKDCCRPRDNWNDGTGIFNLGFIRAFVRLVATATHSLQAFREVNFLRIRFVDLDAQYPLLSPYFQLQGNKCAGIWDDEILTNLATARPKALFNLAESLDKDPATMLLSTRRPKSINVSTYVAFTQRRQM